MPEPVWKTSTTNSSSKSPLITFNEASIIASAILLSRTPNSLLALAAESLICPIAFINYLPNLSSLIGKFNSALLVFAP